MPCGKEGVGTYFGWTMRLFGLPIEGFDVFTEFVPNKRITDRSSLGLAGTWTYTFEPEGLGTRFTMWRHPASMRVLRPVDLLFDRYRASITHQMLGKLKAEMEKGSPCRAQRLPSAQRTVIAEHARTAAGSRLTPRFRGGSVS